MSARHIMTCSSYHKWLIKILNAHVFLVNEASHRRSNDRPEDLGIALVELSVSLVSPGVQVSPSLDQVQEAINKVAKIILSTAKGVSQWIRCRKEDVSEGFLVDCIKCFEVFVKKIAVLGILSLSNFSVRPE